MAFADPIRAKEYARKYHADRYVKAKEDANSAQNIRKRAIEDLPEPIDGGRYPFYWELPGYKDGIA
jgi:hypothetical protein